MYMMWIFVTNLHKLSGKNDGLVVDKASNFDVATRKLQIQKQKFTHNPAAQDTTESGQSQDWQPGLVPLIYYHTIHMYMPYMYISVYTCVYR